MSLIFLSLVIFCSTADINMPYSHGNSISGSSIFLSRIQVLIGCSCLPLSFSLSEHICAPLHLWTSRTSGWTLRLINETWSTHLMRGKLEGIKQKNQRLNEGEYACVLEYKECLSALLSQKGICKFRVIFSTHFLIISL